ncbi:MAG: carboxypeptidase-like regulatory domain-containing protein [Terracidiphilus sp.]
MRLTVSGKVGISNQRGFWLRCFLRGAFCIWLCLAGANSLIAQVDIPGPERLSHVDGYVVNPVGHPAVNVAVTLVRDDKVAYQTKTDKSGEFRFDHVSGQYTLRVARSAYAPATREIVVTDEMVTALERKKLYIILGPGACADACSSVLTNKKEFDKAIRENAKR